MAKGSNLRDRIDLFNLETWNHWEFSSKHMDVIHFNMAFLISNTHWLSRVFKGPKISVMCAQNADEQKGGAAESTKNCESVRWHIGFGM